jgi:hypothetical protein
MEGTPYETIAARLGNRRKTVADLTRRARQKLGNDHIAALISLVRRRAIGYQTQTRIDWHHTRDGVLRNRLRLKLLIEKAPTEAASLSLRTVAIAAIPFTSPVDGDQRYGTLEVAGAMTSSR